MTTYDCPVCGQLHQFHSNFVCLQGMRPLASEAHDFGLCKTHHDMRVAGVILAIPVDNAAMQSGSEYAVPAPYRGTYIALNRDYFKDKYVDYDLHKLDGMAHTIVPFEHFNIAAEIPIG